MAPSDPGCITEDRHLQKKFHRAGDHGFNDRSMYNQVANYAYLDTGVNISIGMSAPNKYFSDAQAQCDTGVIKVGTITDHQAFLDNLAVNCIPANVMDMEPSD